MKTQEFTSTNREAWEEAAPLHRSQNQADSIKDFSKPGYSCLDDIESARLKALDIVGKDVAQICCNNGRELLSVKNMGAARCVGFDGAQGFVNQAKELANAGNIDCEFVCTDIYDMDAQYHNSFDVVYITIGVLSWMPDLNAFMAIVAKMIRPGGALFIYEQHPILNMIEGGESDAPVVWELSYFDQEPYVDTTGLDYYEGGTYDSKTMYSFAHTMAETIMAGVNNGMIVEHFEELPGHISNYWWNVEKQGPRLPMSFTLVMRK